jgi:DNA-binding response OmpR family regulator
LIITEVTLPDQSGLRFCQEMNKSSKTSHVPIIVITEQGLEKQAAACLRAGADDYLAKPIDLELLFLKIQRLLTKLDSDSVKPGVNGSLDDMSFTDMIQIICAGAKSMQILLTHADRKGEVLVEDGEIVHAQTGDKKGEQAFYDMMTWREGDFTTRQCDEFPEKTIRSSAMSLLMEGARLADETKDTS